MVRTLMFRLLVSDNRMPFHIFLSQPTALINMSMYVIWMNTKVEWLLEVAMFCSMSLCLQS